jgi:hypothetical protein
VGRWTLKPRRQAAAALVVSTCESQGLPAKVTDPAVLHDVITLLQTDRHEDALDLHAPNRANPLRIEPVESSASGGDNGVIE